MRGKRSKQYRKLMQQFELNFGFREPYQVLGIIKDAHRFKMDLVGGLERTLHGKVKPMITQCCMRHLYGEVSEPGMADLIEQTKSTFERRRCDHHPDEYPEPLTATACLASVVDPKDNGTNKHRYVVASQDTTVRQLMRVVHGVPLIYINRSVMIMEPMAAVSEKAREAGERSKFRAGLRAGYQLAAQVTKRKREDDDADNDDKRAAAGAAAERKRIRARGTSGPNPLSVKKAKKPAAAKSSGSTVRGPTGRERTHNERLPNRKETEDDLETENGETGRKRKRVRKHKSKGDLGEKPEGEE